ncbi:RNA polymerase sigma factor [Tautonia plasticadhaerens]|uniref:ECF RNA polymerase sigma factor SigE n=1 Tax=Tautonia plasticadhaerens TaxID=2527974 RepID=A0A518HE08_9BACT|nr:sigma-70 family RNA polymerase sigma factor [Tautonia plasticadhaerens]QDV39088.1 ECF RNA polymerase sigma factor SigE [Tautonia plasticadhaerens]
MERLSSRVYSLARYTLGSAQDAEDVTQEVFIRLWENWAQVDLERVEGWLIRVTSNACVDFRRRSSARPEAGGSRAPTRAIDRCPSAATDPSTAAESSELRSRVADAIARLQEPYRSVLILREIEGLPYAEISQALGMSMPSVKVNLHRARARLTELLGPLGDPPSSSGQRREAGERVH